MSDLIDEIKKIKNPYPPDIFTWDNPDKFDHITIGRFHQFCYQIAENMKDTVIRLIEEIEEE